MMKLGKAERNKLDTCLDHLLDEQDGIYIPPRVMQANKLTFDQKQLYGLLCMQASTSGVVANGTHLVYILGGLTDEVAKDLERLKQLAISPLSFKVSAFVNMK